MIAPPMPVDESNRLHELYSLELLDTPYEKEFSDIVRIASKICDTPISLISLIDKDRQWFKAKYGLESLETHRNISFCGYSILGETLFEVSNALEDERFYDNPLVTGNPNIRFYAGMPLIGREGYKLGTICVIDTVPRTLDEDQVASLAALARQVMAIIDLRIKIKELDEVTKIKNRIISIIGHDVRNPLASIKSILDLRNNDIISADEEAEFFKLADNQLDSTLEMVKNLAEWGALSYNYHNRVTAIGLSSLTNECIKGTSLGAAIKNNTIVNETDDLILAAIDKNSLAFILRNLITNANKFTQGGTITIGNTIENGKHLISVSDTGTGMNTAKVSSVLFNKKTQTTTGTKQEAGTGLGLMLISDFLHRINGELFIHSTPGKGSRVSFTLC